MCTRLNLATWAKTIIRVVVPSSDLRFKLRCWVYRAPWISELAAALDPEMSNARLTRSTQLLIEGFPRSGNSFLRAVVRSCAPELEASSHMHSPRPVARAVKRGVPVVVLIRSPRDAVASAVQFVPGLSVSTALQEWIAFYQPIMKMSNSVLIIGFESLVGDPARAIALLTDRFGLDCGTFAATHQALELVTREIDDAAIAKYGEQRMAHVVARPDSTRIPASEMFRELTPTESQRLQEADLLYQLLAEHAS